MATRVGAMVATLLAARGESVSGVALAIGVHRNRLADKIAGRRAFTEEEICRLAEHFGVEPGHLFRDPFQLLGVTPVGLHGDGLLTSSKYQQPWSAVRRSVRTLDRSAA